MAEDASAESTIRQLQERIKKLEEDNKKWMRLAGINRLTELPNGLMLYQVVLPGMVKKGVEEPVSLACALISPDRLGDINQEHGRVIGDQLIQQIGAFLKGQLEEGERLFHCDGANFAILTPGSLEGHVKRRVGVIKTQFARETFKVGDNRFTELAFSVGVAEIEGRVNQDDVAASVERMYDELCNRLYEAKNRGGGQTVGSSKASWS